MSSTRGGPVILPWLDDALATLLAWFPGQEMGGAIADVLSGAREPGGRIPTTWAALEDDVPVWQIEPVDGKLFYAEGLNVGYREWARRVASGGPVPAIPFGHGLGYTKWELGDPTLAGEWRWQTAESQTDEAREVTGPSAPSGFTVSVPVTNVGDRAGKQVVQVYLSRVSGSVIERPVLWLAGYAVVRSEAGASSVATIPIERRSLQHWSVDDHAWRTEPGIYAVRVGTSVAALSAPVQFTI